MKRFNNVQGERLFALLKQSFSDAESFQSEQATKYTEAWDYFLGKKPLRLAKSGSDFVEPVLRDAVDRLLPQQLSIFTANESQAVIYRPAEVMISPEGKPLPTTMIADAVNKKINEIFLRQNNGYEILNEAFTEALIIGGAYLKWFVEESREEQAIELPDWTELLELDPILKAFPDTDFSVAEIKVENISQVDQATGQQVEIPIPFIRGKVDLLKINRDIKLDHVGLAEMFIEKGCTSISDCRYLCHRQKYTVGELVEMGFKRSKIETSSSMPYESSPLDKIDLLIDGTLTSDLDYGSLSYDDNERDVYLYEHFIYTSLMNKRGKSELLRVFATDNQILEVHCADRIPFTYGKAITIGGSFLGMSMYDICKDHQDSLSNAMRLQMDDSAKRTHPRYYALKGGYDKRSLLDNRVGGIIEVNLSGAIEPEQLYSTLPDFATIQAKLAESRDRSIGTQVSSNLETSSMNNVNSLTVSMILGNEEIKDRRIAGTFARTMIQPLFSGLYSLLREEGVDLTLEDGSRFNTSALPKVSDFAIDVLTQSDKGTLISVLTEAAKLANLAAQNPNLSVNIRAIIEEMLTATSLTKDQAAKFIVPEKQPTPEEQQEMMLRKQLEVQGLQAQLENLQAQTQNLLITVAKEEVRTSEMLLDGVNKRQRDEESSLRAFQELDLKAQELGGKLAKMESDVVMDRAELELEAKQNRPVLIGN
ncbi:portal protein [Enterovibrio baiacu]|uniref:portal protein n=1 Tax=Enterovibrio baiacu TaxID=2491023 RepID=UPI0010139567|nr:hypothetical protein [Enterovibrio baiacu]MBE1275101.1 hypothetical protein [Enterovibrio baiacu]